MISALASEALKGVSDHYKVHKLGGLAYVISCKSSVTEAKSCVSIVEFPTGVGMVEEC
jgi:hypothetical protein